MTIAHRTATTVANRAVREATTTRGKELAADAVVADASATRSTVTT